MAINSLARARDHILKLQASTKRAREKAGEVMETAIETGETVGTAFAFGLWAGKVNDDKHFELAGIPIPLLVGLGAHGAALLGVGRGMESHFRSVGNGALSAHLFGIGHRMGDEWRIKSGGASAIPPTALPGTLPGAQAAHGLAGASLPHMQGAGVTEADLARMARI